MRLTSEIGPNDKLLTCKETCRRLHCRESQIATHVARGALTQYREKPAGHCRVYYLEREVDELSRTWIPKRRRGRRVKLTVELRRGEIAARAIPMIRAGRSLEDISVACRAHPSVIQEIAETLSYGLDGAKRRREDIERAERARREDRADMQRRRADEYYARLRRERRRAG